MTTNYASLERVKYKPGKNPNSKKNLKPFHKGENGDHSHNGYTLTSALKDALLSKDKKKRDELILSTIEGAILREPTPFKEVWDRVEGKLQGDQAVINFNEIKIVVVREAPKQLPTVTTIEQVTE